MCCLIEQGVCLCTLCNLIRYNKLTALLVILCLQSARHSKAKQNNIVLCCAVFNVLCYNIMFCLLGFLFRCLHQLLGNATLKMGQWLGFHAALDLFLDVGILLSSGVEETRGNVIVITVM
jgi:hypothetical protein